MKNQIKVFRILAHTYYFEWHQLVCRTELSSWPCMVAHKEPRFLSGGFMVCSAELIQHSSELSNVAHPLSDWPKVLVHSQLLLLFFHFFFFKFPPAAFDALRNIHITPQGQIWEMKTSQRRNSHTCDWNLFTSLYSYEQMSKGNNIWKILAFYPLYYRFFKI